jgi:hypothetical protein
MTPEPPPLETIQSDADASASPSQESNSPPVEIGIASPPGAGVPSLDGADAGPPLGPPVGRLPPEVIQHIVRENFGRFRRCYKNGLARDPHLQGQVRVRFVIGRSGAVSMAADDGSDLPDRNVVLCVVRGFGSLAFPQPKDRTVTVIYPIMFKP